MSYRSYEIEVDAVNESEWSELMGLFADANIYQTWQYGAVRWGLKSLSHLVVKRGGLVLGMAQLRIIRPVNLGFGVAYLRWGPLCQLNGRDPDGDVTGALAAALREEYAVKRGLYLEVHANAFAGSSRGEMMRSAFSQFDCSSGIGPGKYRTLLVDLSPSLEQLRRSLDKKWRNQLSAAERNGLEVVEGDDAEQYRDFCGLYAEMWSRKRFPTNVSVEEFGRIQDRLPKNQRMKVLICKREGQAIAGLVGSVMGDTAIYVLGATNEAGMRLKGAYLLQWFLIQSLKNTGVRYYDLGGINPDNNPGVYHFKKGLSGVDACHISPMVTCERGLSLGVVGAVRMLRSSLHLFRYRSGNAQTAGVSEARFQ